MSNYTLSPNMGLTIPNIGTDPTPEWPANVNACLTILDQHTHVPGSGVQITPGAININSALNISNQSLINIGVLTFKPQLSTPALDSIYISGVDLFYVDGNNNNIQLTIAGSPAGVAGSITGLSSPATASYSSPTFTFQSAANVAASIDGRNFILRNSTASSHGLTLSPPSAMASNFGITLPTLPASQSILTIDNSGVMAAPVVYPIIGAGIASQTITQGLLALRSTGTSVAAGGIAISASSGSFFATLSSGTVVVTNLSVTIVTTGRPVMVMIIPDPAFAGVGYIASDINTQGYTFFKRGSTNIGGIGHITVNSGTSEILSTLPTIDIVTAGTYTYTFWMGIQLSSGNVYCHGVMLAAYEL